MTRIKHTRYVADEIPTLEAAWEFVFDVLPSMGTEPPTIIIKPHWLPADDPDDHPYYFEVSVDSHTKVE